MHATEKSTAVLTKKGDDNPRIRHVFVSEPSLPRTKGAKLVL